MEKENLFITKKCFKTSTEYVSKMTALQTSILSFTHLKKFMILFPISPLLKRKSLTKSSLVNRVLDVEIPRNYFLEIVLNILELVFLEFKQLQNTQNKFGFLSVHFLLVIS